MKGFFGETKAKNNEEYRILVKRRLFLYSVLLIIGTVTLLFSLLAEFFWEVKLNDHILGIFLGVSAGLTAASTVLLLKNKLLLKNEAKLKQERLEATDERYQEISHIAFRIASTVLLICLYLLCFIGGLFYPILSNVLLILIAVFLISYWIAYFIINRKM